MENETPQVHPLHFQFVVDHVLQEYYVPSNAFKTVEAAREYICQVYEITPQDIKFCKAITNGKK